MKSMPKKRIVVILTVSLVLLVTSVTLAANGYGLPWWTVDGGGGHSSGGGYSLQGTIGQHDAGVMSGGGYTLGGGFWGGTAATGPEGQSIYLPLVVR